MDAELAAFENELKALESAPTAPKPPKVQTISAAPVKSCSATTSVASSISAPPGRSLPPSQWATPDQIRADLGAQGFIVPMVPSGPSATEAPARSSIKPASFMPASSFLGARPDYVFKNGSQGLGYYHEDARTLPMKPPPQLLPPPSGPGSSSGNANSHAPHSGSAHGNDTFEGHRPDDSNRNIMRTVAGQSWKDETLLMWPEDDFRIFVGDLGNEASDDLLTQAFQHYPSFQMARVVKDKQSKKTKGYGFVSFKDPWDMTKALREMQGKYVGNRPIKVRKSTSQERQAGEGGHKPLQFNAALSVVDKSLKRQLEKGGAIQKKPTWKESKKQKKMLPW